MAGAKLRALRTLNLTQPGFQTLPRLNLHLRFPRQLERLVRAQFLWSLRQKHIHKPFLISGDILSN